MWIRRVAVRHWRGLDFELAGLSPHLNLIFGPNEAGKSRLVEAMRFALFESSKGKSEHKKAIETWGRTPEKPTVTLEFELDRVSWRLDKTFLGTGCNTSLRADGVGLEGAEAEDRLMALIGVGPGGRKALKSEDLGIWSLLWVDQGESREAPAHNSAAQTQLQAQLTREIGEVAAGERGQTLLRRAEEQRNHYYSASRNAERNALTEPRQRVDALTDQLAEARTRRDGVAADADALDERRRAEHDLVPRVAEAQARLEDLRVLEQRATELGQQLELRDAAVHNSERERDHRNERLQRARDLDDEAISLNNRVDAAAADWAAADAARGVAQETADARHSLAGDADERQVDAAHQVTQLRRRRERSQLAEQAGALRRRLGEADQIGQRLTAIQQTLAALPAISAADVEQLRRAQEARDAANARLEGASASVELLARRELQVDGEPLPAGTTRRILIEDEQRLDVDGLLSITVRPGGGELPRLREARRDADQVLAQQLAARGVAGLAEAERFAHQRRDQEAELARCRGELERHLPEGREAAGTALRELDARLAAQDGDAGPFDPAALEQAEAALRTATTARDEARTRRDVAFEHLADARERAATCKADLLSLERQRADARTRRGSLPEQAVLVCEAELAERTWRERVVARDAMEREFEELGGGDIPLDLEQATRAHEQLSQELEQVRLARTRLAARLEAVGDDGRHERVQALEAELSEAEGELARAERHAAAARRLHEVLLDEYEQARERLAAPVIARIRPHLQSLFPDTEVWLDEDLTLKGLRSADTNQAFEALSGGAREQLALLVRVGLAEVLGTEEPHPLVLDDVLVNTDAERIRLVQRVLFQASRRMQILLFTCHGPLFDALGADARLEIGGAR